jgi:hypothetical protein
MTLKIFMDMTPSCRKPFRLVESYETIDGTRERLSHRAFREYDQAVAFVKIAEDV